MGDSNQTEFSNREKPVTTNQLYGPGGRFREDVSAHDTKSKQPFGKVKTNMQNYLTCSKSSISSAFNSIRVGNRRSAIVSNFQRRNQNAPLSSGVAE